LNKSINEIINLKQKQKKTKNLLSDDWICVIFSADQTTTQMKKNKKIKTIKSKQITINQNK
jgi:hypothetical protein